MEIKEINCCRICKNKNLLKIMDIGPQVLTGRFPEKGEIEPPETPLELVKCDDSKDKNACGLLQLRHSVSTDDMFAHSYGYRSGLNKTMINHLSGITKIAEEKVSLKKDDIVVDIGSNDATLLKSYNVPGIIKIGIDPTIKHFKNFYTEDIIKVEDYFTSKTYFSATNYPKNSIKKDQKAKVVTSISMFYDLEDPISFAKDVAAVLDKNGIWIFEQSYMPLMLEMNSFDTICQEHLEYYAIKQINWILDSVGMKMIDISFNKINGGSFRIYAAHKDSEIPSDESQITTAINKEKSLKLDTVKSFNEFKNRVEKLKKDTVDFIKKEKNLGKTIFLYGASTKGNVLLQYYGLDSSIITAAADRNPEKDGRRTPKTNIPIVSEIAAREFKPDYFLVLPWHFKEEFLEREIDFLKKGGKFIFPLPYLEIIDFPAAQKYLKKENHIAWGKPVFLGNERRYLIDALDSQWISGGKYVDIFEKNFAEISGRKYGLSVSNGTTALHLALVGLDIKSGDEVLVPGFSFIAAANSIIYSGATPVFCDIDPETWNISLESVKKNITKKTKAIIVVHNYGNVSEMKELLDIAKKNNIYVIEDVAEALFSKYDGEYAGKFGYISCFSFQSTKTITMGEGGIVLTDDKTLFDRMKILRSHGMDQKKKYWHDFVGYNYRLTNMQAALGVAQLEIKDIMIKKKIRIYERYVELLSGLRGIKLQKITKNTQPVMWAIAVEIDEKIIGKNRDTIIDEFAKKDIETRPGFYPACVLPLYKKYLREKINVCEKVGLNTIVLPSHADLSDEDLTRIVATFKEILKK